MKHHFVIEADTDMYIVFVREVKQDFDDKGIVYTCPADTDILVMEQPSPEFYGQLDALLVTKGKVRDAKPITPLVPLEASEAEEV